LRVDQNNSSIEEAEMAYRRVLLKLSGGAIGGKSNGVFDAEAIKHVVGQILSARELGVEIAVVVGGGNIFRGRVAESWQIERTEADNIGMLGTLINAVMLRAALKALCHVFAARAGRDTASTGRRWQTGERNCLSISGDLHCPERMILKRTNEE
jgi:uridylate kinase